MAETAAKNVAGRELGNCSVWGGLLVREDRVRVGGEPAPKPADDPGEQRLGDEIALTADNAATHAGLAGKADEAFDLAHRDAPAGLIAGQAAGLPHCEARDLRVSSHGLDKAHRARLDRRGLLPIARCVLGDGRVGHEDLLRFYGADRAGELVDIALLRGRKEADPRGGVDLSNRGRFDIADRRHDYRSAERFRAGDIWHLAHAQAK